MYYFNYFNEQKKQWKNLGFLEEVFEEGILVYSISCRELSSALTLVNIGINVLCK